MITVTLTNNSLEAAENVTIQLTTTALHTAYVRRVLWAGTTVEHNTFEAIREVVTEQAFAVIDEKTADGIRA